MEKQTQNRLMDMGRGEERVRCMGRVTWKLTLPYVKQIINGNLLYVSGNSNRGSVSTWRVGIGQKMGGDICIPMADSLVAKRLKHLTPMRETQVRSLGREDSPGEGRKR